MDYTPEEDSAQEKGSTVQILYDVLKAVDYEKNKTLIGNFQKKLFLDIY